MADTNHLRRPNRKPLRLGGRFARNAALVGVVLLPFAAGCSGDTGATSSTSATDPATTSPQDATTTTTPVAADSTRAGWSPTDMLAPGQTAEGGFEILERQPDGALVVWLTLAITKAEFDALELPPNWIKNQPRGSGGDTGGRFFGSPGSTDGTMDIEELFGHRWAHVATVVKVGVHVDDEGLLVGNLIAKEHQVTYPAGATVPLLISPQGDVYPLVSRDTGRTTDESPIPQGWRIVEHTFTEDFTTRLPNPTLNIRTKNQDSYQGPVSGLDVAS
jgi:hypothetical protein